MVCGVGEMRHFGATIVRSLRPLSGRNHFSNALKAEKNRALSSIWPVSPLHSEASSDAASTISERPAPALVDELLKRSDRFRKERTTTEAKAAIGNTFGTAARNLEFVTNISEDAVLKIYTIIQRGLVLGEKSIHYRRSRYIYTPSVEASALRYTSNIRAGLGDWEKVSTHRDLHIKGLGSFNVEETYNAVLRSRAEQAIGEYGPIYGLLNHFYNKRIKKLAQEFKVTEDELKSKSKKALIATLRKHAPYEKLQLRLFTILLDESHDEIFTKEGRRQPQVRWVLSEQQIHGPIYWMLSEQYMEAMHRLVQRLILSPSELQAAAYFGQVTAVTCIDDRVSDHVITVLRADETNPVRQHLIRYRHLWNDPDNAAMLNELAMSVERCSNPAYWPSDWTLQMKPQELINRLRKLSVQRRAGPDVKYSHLDDLQDSKDLRVVRSSHQLVEVGRQLRNCAASYQSQIASEQCALVALVDEKKRYIALGEYRFQGQHARLAQLKKVSNQTATTEMKTAFEHYTRAIIAPWLKQQSTTDGDEAAT